MMESNTNFDDVIDTNQYTGFFETSKCKNILFLVDLLTSKRQQGIFSEKYLQIK